MKIVYLGPLARELVKTALAGSQFELVAAEPDSDLDNILSDASVLITTGPTYSQKVAEAAKKSSSLKLIQLTSAGFENVEKFGAPSGAQLCNAAEAWSIAVAEHAMAMMLALRRRLIDALSQQRENQWNRTYADNCRSMYGSTVLIVGYGRIGKQIARRAKAFSMRIIAVSAESDRDDYVDELVGIDALYTALPKADIVVAAVPSTPETVNMFNTDSFAHFKPGSTFINVARGDVVNAVDLEAALRSNHIGGAAIDVTVPEPLPSHSPLWAAPNLIITPHVAGAVPDLVPLNIRDVVVENLKRLANGETLKNLVVLK
ncbi:MAG: D-2-hydroxyacid dehydrogenase [Proteobacteria bacterium]|nr:D-2-hydroxyacid dehydrogenase [Pseudomonadota bacterium]